MFVVAVEPNLNLKGAQLLRHPRYTVLDFADIISELSYNCVFSVTNRVNFTIMLSLVTDGKNLFNPTDSVPIFLRAWGVLKPVRGW